MKKYILILALFVTTNVFAEYIIAYKGSIPIQRHTRLVSLQPTSWTNALTELSELAQQAADANLTAEQVTDRNTCLYSLATLMGDFQIALPLQPSTAMAQMFAYWQAHLEDTSLTAKAQQIQFLYSRLRMEYGMTDAQIGGLE